MQLQKCSCIFIFEIYLKNVVIHLKNVLTKTIGVNIIYVKEECGF